MYLFEESSGGRNLASRFHGGVANGIPYGLYHCRVRLEGFWTTDREILVSQSNVLALVALNMGVEGGWPVSRVFGNIEGVHEPSLNVRLMGVYSEVIMDTVVSEEGKFEFSGVPEGTYVLLVADEGNLQGNPWGRVLFCETVNAKTSITGPVLIKLSAPRD